MGLAGTAVVALGTGVYVSAPYEQGQVYPLSEVEVYQRLVDMPLPPELEKTVHEAEGAELDVEATPGEGVRWSLRQNGTMALRMVARVTAEGPTSTRVKVDFEVGDLVALERDRPGSAAREIEALKSDPMIQGVVRIALHEQVSATLESRAFDKRKAQREAMIFVARNPSAVAALKSKLSSAEYEARLARLTMSDNDRAELYRRDVTDRRDWVDRDLRPGRPMMSARPMIDSNHPMR